MLGSKSLLRFALRTALRTAEYGLTRTGYMPAAKELVNTVAVNLQRWAGKEPPKPVDLTFKIQEEVIKVDIRVEQVVKMSINVDQVDMAITVRETLPPVKPLHGTSLIQARRTASEPRQDLSQCGWLTSKIGNKSTIPTWAN